MCVCVYQVYFSLDLFIGSGLGVQLCGKASIKFSFSVAGSSTSLLSHTVPGLIPTFHSLLVGLIDSKITTLAVS